MSEEILRRRGGEMCDERVHLRGAVGKCYINGSVYKLSGWVTLRRTRISCVCWTWVRIVRHCCRSGGCSFGIMRIRSGCNCDHRKDASDGDSMLTHDSSCGAAHMPSAPCIYDTSSDSHTLNLGSHMPFPGRRSDSSGGSYRGADELGENSQGDGRVTMAT